VGRAKHTCKHWVGNLTWGGKQPGIPGRTPARDAESSRGNNMPASNRNLKTNRYHNHWPLERADQKGVDQDFVTKGWNRKNSTTLPHTWHQIQTTHQANVCNSKGGNLGQQQVGSPNRGKTVGMGERAVKQQGPEPIRPQKSCTRKKLRCPGTKGLGQRCTGGFEDCKNGGD